MGNSLASSELGLVEVTVFKFYLFVVCVAMVGISKIKLFGKRSVVLMYFYIITSNSAVGIYSITTKERKE